MFKFFCHSILLQQQNKYLKIRETFFLYGFLITVVDFEDKYHQNMKIYFRGSYKKIFGEQW